MKNTNKKHTIGYLFVIIMLTGILTACKGASSVNNPVITNPPPVISNTGVVVEGKVVPSQFANISFNKSGVVAEVLVKEGASSQSGDVIARLENSEALQAEVARAEDVLLQAQQALDDLTENTALDRANGLKSVADAYDALRTADRQLYYFTVPANQRDLEMFAAVDLMRQRLEKARKDWEPYKYEEEEWTWQWKNSPRGDIKQALDDAEGDFRTAMLRIIYAADKAKAEETLAKVKKDYDILQKGPDPDELAAAESRLKNAQTSLDAAKAALQDLELKAPFSGVIAKLDLKVGESVTLGQAVVTIADFSKWMVETDDLTEIEVVEIQQGQAARVVPDALPDANIAGTVESINDVYEEKRGDITYTVKITLADHPPQLRWGMTVAVTFAK
jgi:multidrug resistance efflux pump